MYLETLEICVLWAWDSAHRLSIPGLAWLQETGIEWELLTDIDMLLVVAKKIRGGICHAIHRYA